MKSIVTAIIIAVLSVNSYCEENYVLKPTEKLKRKQTQEELNDLKTFDKIQIGQTREELVKLIGEPVRDVGNELYYGQVPTLGVYQSPMSPRRIVVTFKKGLVIQVAFYSNFQRFTLHRSFDKKLVTRLLGIDADE